MSVNDANSVLSYYAADRSTAKFYNHDTMENGEWKTKNWQLNMGSNFRSELLSLLYVARSKQDIGYVASSWQALQDAITAAMELFATLNYTTTQVDNAQAALQNALDALQLLPDASALQVLINQADEIQNDGYTASTWTRFEDARAFANSLLARPEYTQKEVEDAHAELSAAISGLTLNAVTPPAPPAALGFDLGSGDISGFLAPALPLFSGYVLSIMPVVIAFFSIYFGIKMLPYVFTRIMRALRK